MDLTETRLTLTDRLKLLLDETLEQERQVFDQLSRFHKITISVTNGKRGDFLRVAWHVEKVNELT